MGHKVIITDKFREIFADSEVRTEMTPQQCNNVDFILNCSDPTPGQFRELTHRLNRIYDRDD